jgi:hypothetical protein
LHPKGRLQTRNSLKHTMVLQCRPWVIRADFDLAEACPELLLCPPKSYAK